MFQREIIGLACPFNVPNSYGEIIRPGAFDKFITRLGGRTLPMLAMHESPIGTWIELKAGSDGLWARGVIRHPNVWAEAIPELSISFYDAKDRPGVNQTITRRRVSSILESSPPWERIVPPFVHVVGDTKVTTEAGLAEISLVDRGAFDGTGYRFV